MASTKPEGLSPCFGSLISPDILSSYKFSWQPPSTQSSFVITLYSSNQTTVLKTYNGTGSISQLTASTLGYTFVNGTTYYWDVSVNGGTKSTKAKFAYKTKAQRPSISWTTTEPKAYDEVFLAGRLQEIKNNTLILLGKYDSVDSKITAKANGLFQGEVVPSRKDFNNLEDVLQYIGKQEEVTYNFSVNGWVDIRTDHGPTRKWDVTDSSFSAYDYSVGTNDTAPNLNIPLWVVDSLGVSDLDNITTYINWLANRQPAPVEDFSITMGSTDMYDITTITASHSGTTDATIDVSWTVEPMPSTNGTINFTTMSSSNNIWFYETRFSYGPNGVYKATLFFDEATLPEGSTITFDAGWSTLYTEDTLDNAMQKMEIYVVDQSANISELRSVTKSYNSNYKAPIGLDYYEMQSQLLDLSNTTYKSTGAWTGRYKSTGKSTTYNVGTKEGHLWHRVRAVDKSGLTSAWVYSGMVTFDPLLPPTAPTALKVAQTYVNELVWSWSHGQRVEYYEVNFYGGHNNFIAAWNIGDNEPITNTTLRSGLSSSTGYVFFIRSHNRVGTSAWVSVSGYTKDGVHTKTWTATASQSWRNNWGWSQDTNKVYQGEWCEIAGEAHPSGPVGTCWGKWKGLWYFDYADIQNTLRGKTILEIKVWINRSDTYHGYYSDQVLHLWTHDSEWHGKHRAGDSEPMLGNHREIRDPQLAKGESAWITLPTSYGDKLRDGSASGFGLYVPNWGRMPYVYCEPNAKVSIKYQE